jgi:hypothetical protein
LGVADNYSGLDLISFFRRKSSQQNVGLLLELDKIVVAESPLVGYDKSYRILPFLGVGVDGSFEYKVNDFKFLDCKSLANQSSIPALVSKYVTTSLPSFFTFDNENGILSIQSSS